MKRFGIKVINLLLCLLTVTVTACKDEEETPFTVNEDGSVRLRSPLRRMRERGRVMLRST